MLKAHKIRGLDLTVLTKTRTTESKRRKASQQSWERAENRIYSRRFTFPIMFTFTTGPLITCLFTFRNGFNHNINSFNLGVLVPLLSTLRKWRLLGQEFKVCLNSVSRLRVAWASWHSLKRPTNTPAPKCSAISCTYGYLVQEMGNWSKARFIVMWELSRFRAVIYFLMGFLSTS